MTEQFHKPPKSPRPILIGRVNFVWYLAPVLPILALGYAALVNWLPSWFLLLAIFALFMWLFSLVFAAYAVLMGKFKERKESRR